MTAVRNRKSSIILPTLLVSGTWRPARGAVNHRVVHAVDFHSLDPYGARKSLCGKLGRFTPATGVDWEPFTHGCASCGAVLKSGRQA